MNGKPAEPGPVVRPVAAARKVPGWLVVLVIAVFVGIVALVIVLSPRS